MDQRPSYRNHIERDGTSQSQRRLQSLDPCYAAVDGRDIADFLVFAKELARIIVYKDDSLTDRGDWEGFFGCDASAVIAAIEKTNPEPIRSAFNSLLAAPTDPAGLRQLLEQLRALTRILDGWYREVGRETPLRAQIDRVIRANLGAVWRGLVGSHRAISAQFPSVSFNPEDYLGYSDAWFSESLQPHPAPRSIPLDPTLFTSSDSEEAQLARAYERLEALFRPVYRVLLEIIRLAPRYFARDLLGRSDHAPHFALFVAFLRLYLRVRDDANRLTQRHLDFFYKSVLRIKKRPAVPDKLHLIAELARQAGDEHLLRAGTELDAGKDKMDKPLRYQVDKELVANKAQIASFKTLFVDYSSPDAAVEQDKDPNTGGAAGRENSAVSERFPRRIFAAPVADSLDGLGAPIEDEERPSWSTLGSTVMPAARLGFVLASKDLLLAEGTRTIMLDISADGFPAGVDAGTLKNALKDAFIAQLSGAEGWIKVPPASTNLSVTHHLDSGEGDRAATPGTLQLALSLPSTAAAVSAADQEALGEDFGTTDPLLKVTLRPPLHSSATEASTPDYDLHLVGEPPEVPPDEGRPSVILILGPDRDLVQLRIFDSSGNQIVDKVRTELIPGEGLDELEKLLLAFSSRSELPIGPLPPADGAQQILERAVQVADYTRAYGLLKGLRLTGVTLTTKAEDVTRLIVQNDQSALDATKPFQPFGPAPAVGSSLYVGSAEAFQKDLHKLTLDITWDGLPDSFSKHYEGYDVTSQEGGTAGSSGDAGDSTPPEVPALSAFKVNVHFLQDGQWFPTNDAAQSGTGDSGKSPETAQTLFEGSCSSPRARRTLDLHSIEALKLGEGQKPRPVEAIGQWTPASQHGFLRLTLTPQAFFHDQYVRVLTRQSLAAARLPGEGVVPPCLLGAKYRVYQVSNTGIDFETGSYEVKTCSSVSDDWYPSRAVAIIPEAPYTPTVKTLKLAYTGVRSTAKPPHGFKFFHLEPFGYRAVPLGPAWQDEEDVAESTEEDPPQLLPREGEAAASTPTKGPPPLLPQIDHEGSLFLGLKDLKPLQSLSILFQVAEATANTNVRRPEIFWSYLTDDRWENFETFEIAEDTSSGLTASGILTFRIPRDISAKSTRMPDRLHWLRAAVRESASGVSELIKAHTQAVRATFVDDGNDPQRLAQPLEANSVAGLVVDDAKVASINQPYISFGGIPVESEGAFYLRVSERLRHKGRPVTLFDYERLILERFPNLYKVKCINHSRISYANGVDTGGDELAPGHVLIAVIADFKQLKDVDRRKPKVTLDKLDAISKFLQEINCPFVHNDLTDKRQRLHISNPIYEEVKVAFRVRFQPDVTAIAFHERKLEQEIIKFLSPWAYDIGADISFGGRVYRSAILNFVEQQPYVDFVTDFSITGGTDGENLTELSGDDPDFIEATTPRSILVPASKHDIRELGAGACEMTRTCPPQQRLGEMTIDKDFVVAPNPEGSS
jgi:hypothetical protein